MLRRTEQPNYTLEQIEQHVRDTLEVAAKCGLTDEERTALLPAIFDKLAGKQIIMEEIGGVLGSPMPRGLG